MICQVYVKKGQGDKTTKTMQIKDDNEPVVWAWMDKLWIFGNKV